MNLDQSKGLLNSMVAIYAHRYRNRRITLAQAQQCINNDALVLGETIEDCQALRDHGMQRLEGEQCEVIPFPSPLPDARLP